MEAEEILANLVACNTIADKENEKILDYLENVLRSMRFSDGKKR